MRALSLESTAGRLDFTGAAFRATVGLTGTGLAPVAPQWFEGAGEGRSWRGTRMLGRTIDLPIFIYGNNRGQIDAHVNQLAAVMHPRAGRMRLAADFDGEQWYADVIREGGGDFEWGVDTDGATCLRIVVSLGTEEAYWTRVTEASITVTPGGFGRGLIRGAGTSLSQLRVSTTSAEGSIPLNNPGNVEVFARWRVRAPFSGFELISPLGESIAWQTLDEGVKLEGHIEVNMLTGTVADETGANMYAGLAGVPRFWPLPAGESVGGVILLDSAADSRTTAYFRPRKEVLF